MAVLYPVEAIALLRACGMRRSQHLLGMLPPAQTEQATRMLDDAVVRVALATCAPELVERATETVARHGELNKLRANVNEQLQLTADFGGADLPEMNALRDLAHVASLAATVPVLISRLASDDRYDAVVRELKAGSTSDRPWAVAMRQARAAVAVVFRTTPAKETLDLEIATRRPDPPGAGAKVGEQEQARLTRLAATGAAHAPDLPTVREICSAQPEDDDGNLGEGLLADGAWWRALQRLGQLYTRSTRLERARLSACAGQGRNGSALHNPPERLGDGVFTADHYRSIARRWLGIPPPGIMELVRCGACGMAFKEGRDDGPGVRAAHLAGCTSANKEESRARGRLPVYDTNHSGLRAAVRACAEEVLGSDFVEEELPGEVENSQKRPGDVTLFLHTHKVAVDVTITYLQSHSSCDKQAKQPGRPVMDEEKAKRRKYKDIEFKDASTLFVPFAVDDFGHIGDAGWAFLEQLAAHGAAKNGGRNFTKGLTDAQVRDYYLTRWQQRIAHVVRASVDRSIQRRLALSRRQLTV